MLLGLGFRVSLSHSRQTGVLIFSTGCFVVNQISLMVVVLVVLVLVVLVLVVGVVVVRRFVCLAMPTTLETGRRQLRKLGVFL